MTNLVNIRDFRTVGVANRIRVATSPSDYSDEPGDGWEAVYRVEGVQKIWDDYHAVSAVLDDGREVGLFCSPQNGEIVYAITDTGEPLRMKITRV